MKYHDMPVKQVEVAKLPVGGHTHNFECRQAWALHMRQVGHTAQMTMQNLGWIG